MVAYHRLALAFLATAILSNALPTESTDKCSTVRCMEDTECAVIDGEARCVPVILEECGPNTCAKGDTCCNESCGICVAPGGACTEQFCLPTGPQCGPTQCYEGEECCNSSCGYCVKPGGGCTKEFCGPLESTPEPEPEEEEEEEEAVKCGTATCEKGDTCCNSSCSICTPPGGACTMQLCGPVEVPEGVQCGANTCAKGQECCNASCGICTNPGDACIQMVCN